MRVIRRQTDPPTPVDRIIEKAVEKPQVQVDIPPPLAPREPSIAEAIERMAAAQRAVAEALAARPSDAPRPTRATVTVTSRDEKGRWKDLVINFE